MSFSFRTEGLVEEVVERVTAAAIEGSQFEAVKAFVLAELEAWPTAEGTPNGVLVEMAGHHDTNSRNVTIVMRPMRVGPLED